MPGPLNPVKANPGVPNRSGIGCDADIKQGFNDLEQAGQHLGCREVGFDFLLAKSVAGFLELLAHIGPVPGLRVVQAQIGGGKLAQIGKVTLGKGPCPLGKVAQECDHLFG